MTMIKKSILTLLYLALLATTLPLLLGFINWVHPLFDSFTNFRVHLLVLSLGVLLFITFLHEKRKYHLSYLTLIALGGFYLYRLLQPFQPTLPFVKNEHNLTHMQFNLNFKNREMDSVVEYIKKHPMDIITLQEVTPAHKKALQSLKFDGNKLHLTTHYPFVEHKKGAYPYQLYCDFRSIAGGAILSKYPINTEKFVCVEEQGLLWAEVQTPYKKINVASIHLRWPFPYLQQMQIEFIKPVLENIPKPTLIAGDFNAVAWSNAVEKIANASNTKVANGLRWSIELEEQLPLLPFMKLSIDQLLVSEELEVHHMKVEKDLGSDHLPVVSEIGY
jgi:endonuclease/exonuclease/phosphatase (EEP) superfamily protein YafD